MKLICCKLQADQFQVVLLKHKVLFQMDMVQVVVDRAHAISSQFLHRMEVTVDINMPPLQQGRHLFWEAYLNNVKAWNEP
jgi:hypothetical protein